MLPLHRAQPACLAGRVSAFKCTGVLPQLLLQPHWVTSTYCWCAAKIAMHMAAGQAQSGSGAASTGQVIPFKCAACLNCGEAPSAACILPCLTAPCCTATSAAALVGIAPLHLQCDNVIYHELPRLDRTQFLH